MDALGAIAIGWFTLGFAAVVGGVLRAQPFGRAFSAVMILLLALYSLALPYPWPQRSYVWAAAALVLARYAGFPRPVPGWAHSPRFTLIYFLLAMLLVIAWAALGWQNGLVTHVGLPALCAAVVLGLRAYQVGKGEM